MLGGKVKKERKDVIIQTPEDVLGEMLLELEKGREKGSTTFINDLDKCWKWRKSETNLWVGMSNEGKSAYLRFISLVKALEDNWRFAFYAPEDYPAKEFYDDMVHTLTGLPTDKDHPMCITEELYRKAIDLIKDKFHFVYIKPPKNTIQEVLEQFAGLMEDYDLDAVIIDPFVKCTRPAEHMQRDDLYAAFVGGMCMDFARAWNVSLHLVMHVITPEIDSNGYYVKPNMYRIRGGGTHAETHDNVLFVQRPKYAKDKLDPTVLFGSQKIKKQKLVGIPQEFMMGFDRKTNRYVNHDTGENLYNFDKWFK